MKMKPQVTRTLVIYHFVLECCDYILVLCLVTTIFSFAMATTILFYMYWNVFVFRTHL